MTGSVRLDFYNINSVLFDSTISISIPSVLKDMEEEDVDPRMLAGELPGCGVIISSNIGDIVSEPNSAWRCASCWHDGSERGLYACNI